MKLLAAKHYDPSTAATANTTAAQAMTALDTTNLRLSVTVPSHGMARVRIACCIHGASTAPQIMLGVLEGSTVRGRVAPMLNVANVAGSSFIVAVADFCLTGLTPGTYNWDAAYGVETSAASSAIKWGGPNNTSSNDAFGAFVFEVYDPAPTGSADWTDDERTAIRAILGIPGSGTTPADPSSGILDTIRDLVVVVDGVADAILDDTGTSGVVVAAGSKTGYSLANGSFVTATFGTCDLTTTMKASVNTEADTALTDAGVTTTRTGYLDKLNITGNVASSGEVTNIQNNTRMVFVVPEQIIRPASGTTTNYVRLYLYDSVGNMEAPDSAPEMELRNVAGTDLSARLTSTTGTLESTGVYRWEYTSATAHTLEQILWSVTVIEGGSTRRNGRTSWIAETYTTDFTSSDRTTLNTIAGFVDSIPADVRTELATELARIDAAISSRLATAGYTAPDNASVTAIKAKTDNLPASPAAVGDAMTLTSGERDSVATALLDLANGVESSVTVRTALRAVGAALAGVLSGAGGTGTATVTVKAIGNAGTTRLTVETDADGNRTSVTLG